MKNKLNTLLLLNWKKILIIIIAWFVAVLLHNVIYGLGIYFGGENFWGPNGDEAFFFIIAVIVIPLYFIIALIYSLIWMIRKKKKIPLSLIVSILIGLICGGIINYLGYFRGPWFFALFSLLIAFIVYSLVKFILKKFK